MGDNLKSKKKKIIILVSALVLVFLIIPSIITISIYNYYFDKRINHENNYFTYLTSINEDFVREDTSFVSDEGQILHGAFYTQAENTNPKGLVIWVHGMFLNHENYLAEIEWLTKQNYVVFSYDNTGVDHSEGESLKGLTQAPIDLKYALEFLHENGYYSDIPHILVGHSWGGFSVSAVNELDVPYEVDGIVSLAGFWKNVNVIEDIAKKYVGNTVMLLHPYLVIYEQYLFGENANLNGVDGLSNTSAPVLMIHSVDDEVVSYESNFKVYQEHFAQDPRFTFIEYQDAGHKLTVKAEAYDKIHDIMHHQLEYEENSAEFLELEQERHSMILDFNLDVMNDILEFCDEICE